jgi:glutamine cyclotransferase
MNVTNKSSFFFIIVLAGFALIACHCNSGGPKDNTPQTVENDVYMPKILTYTIKATHPHDPKAFTQGLIWHNGQLVEGTGMEGESNLRMVTLETGKVTAQINNTPEIFGEGVTYLNGKFYQITWQNNKGFVYDAKTLNKILEFPLNTEGWGLTTNGVELIVSDGSSNIYFLDTATFREKRRIGVRMGERPYLG